MSTVRNASLLPLLSIFASITISSPTLAPFINLKTNDVEGNVNIVRAENRNSSSLKVTLGHDEVTRGVPIGQQNYSLMNKLEL